jgi:hypothetical protein
VLLLSLSLLLSLLCRCAVVVAMLLHGVAVLLLSLLCGCAVVVAVL